MTLYVIIFSVTRNFFLFICVNADVDFKNHQGTCIFRVKKKIRECKIKILI